ncbi:MAG: hypothetical protein ACOC8N_02210 [Spirochaetota bacterium]
MTMLFEVLFALGIGLMLTAVFAGLLGRSGPWASIPVFFAIIFLASWAGGVWIAPVGPALFGVYWVPFLIFGLIIALLLAAAVKPRVPVMAGEDEGTKREPGKAAYDAFFFGLIVLLAVAILVGYLI